MSTIGMKQREINPQYLMDDSGKRKFVVLTVKEYEELLEDLHDLAVIAARRHEPTMTLDEFKQRLEADGRL
jgi:PHD/YefM family antitoxin component YafN of YafNO toxin-antitoxin module